MKTIFRTIKRYGSVCAPYATLVTFIFCANFAGIGSASAKGFLTTGKFTSPPVGAFSICKTYAWACSAKSNGHTVALSEVNRVNRIINRRVFQINDQVQYGVPEKWTLPSKRGGDCEDIALLKKYVLIRQGVAPNRLLIATALDRKLRPHAVLVFRSDQGDLVLDSAHGEILAWADTGYTFLRMQDPNNPRKWQALLRGGVASSKRVFVKSGGVAAISPFTGAKSQSGSRDSRPTPDR